MFDEVRASDAVMYLYNIIMRRQLLNYMKNIVAVY
jgi:hypothetical protein